MEATRVSLSHPPPEIVSRLALKLAAGLTQEGPGGCREWGGNRTPKGYGMIKLGKRNGRRHVQVYAHRLAYELAHGPIPEGMYVMHSCDNPPCCNPNHLRIGTPADNARDRDEKGRARDPRGENAGTAKLSWEKVRAIRERWAAGGVSLAALGRRYGVSYTAISNVVTGRSWKEMG